MVVQDCRRDGCDAVRRYRSLFCSPACESAALAEAERSFRAADDAGGGNADTEHAGVEARETPENRETV